MQTTTGVPYIGISKFDIESYFCKGTVRGRITDSFGRHKLKQLDVFETLRPIELANLAEASPDDNESLQRCIFDNMSYP